MFFLIYWSVSWESLLDREYEIHKVKSRFCLFCYSLMEYTTMPAKISMAIIKILYRILDLFLTKKRKYPRKDFEENPRTMWLWGALYLWYKYLYKPYNDTNDPVYNKQYFHTQKLPLTTTKPKKDELVIHIAGDMKQHSLFTAESTKHLRDDIGNEYFAADTVIANLETPIDLKKKTHKDPLIMLHDIYFNAHKNFYNIFSAHGKWKYSLLLTANNHSLDQWEHGNVMTCRFLDEYKIPYIWSRLTKRKPRYYIVEKKGIKVAYINYTFSCNQNIPSEEYAFAINYLRLNTLDTDISQITADVTSAKKAWADFVIFCPHMGNAYQLYPSGHIVRMVHRFFDECGVDAVVCTHPHNLQPMEMYAFTDPYTGKKKQGFVVYSLGDFVSYDTFPRSRLWAIVQLCIKKTKTATKLSWVQFIPLYMQKSWKKHTLSFRLLDLEKVVHAIKKNAVPVYVEDKGGEALYLHNIFHKYIVPKQ